MLSPDVAIEGFAAADWAHLQSLWSRKSPDAPPGLILIADERGVRKAWQGGRRAQPDAFDGHSLEAIVRAGTARWAVRIHKGALEELIDEWADRLTRDQVLLGQGLELLRVFQQFVREGRIEVFPHRIGRFPLPAERAVERALDGVCPVGKTLLFASFLHGHVASCVAARRGERGFERIVGPEWLRRDMGLVSRDWTRDYRHLARATELAIGPLAVGCFAEAPTWRSLLGAAPPGAWAAAVAARDVVLQPVTSVLAIPLGLDLGRAAVATVRDLARRIGVSAWLAENPTWSPALGKARALIDTEFDLERILGFDPIELIREALEQNEDAWRR